MTREELAARIFVTQLCDDDCGLDALCSWSFDMADTFLEYAAKQREPKACPCLPEWQTTTGCAHCGAPKVKPEPPKPECEHRWSTYTSLGRPEDTTEYCLNCDAKKPDPPKPERVARRIWVANGYECDHITQSPPTYQGDWTEYLEVLPGDEHDKR